MVSLVQKKVINSSYKGLSHALILKSLDFLDTTFDLI
jgi:hypothetical protein